jgi:hypothetical protein
MNPDYIMRSVALLLFLAVAFGLLALGTAAAKEMPSPPFVFNPEKLMAAIAAVENTPRNKQGASGERSEFQLTEDVWDEHSRHPFWWASSDQPTHRLETLRVVRAHLSRLYRLISHEESTRLSEYAIFAAYKGGWTRFHENRIRPADIDYALRCLNVYAQK